MRLVRVAPGVFTMGSELDEPMRQEEEVPRTIRLTKAFRISATEVTNAQWRAVMGSGSTPGRADDYPVVEVSWKDASEFCRRLSAQEDRSYRLPTEAEWEYACRAGTRSGPPGPVELDAAAWYDANSDGAAQPVGRRAPTVWGLHDMLGNVMEWCSDYYGPYDQRVSTDPIGPADGRARVARGGSWRHFRPACRCAARIGLPESYQLGYVGFRVILDATE
jgi:formylglycine-generating enzyme required for sulfatase activity